VAKVRVRKRLAKVLTVDETLDRVDTSLDRFDASLTEFSQTLAEFNRTLSTFTAALEQFGGVVKRVDEVGVELEGVTGRLGPLLGGLMSSPTRAG
jgi:ABC-type transporter Mla subunit MlaD